MYPINGFESECEHKQGGKEYNHCIKSQQLEITAHVLLYQPPTTPNPAQNLTSQNAIMI
jgi:hypothetical protein